jgi:hypothetical protein
MFQIIVWNEFVWTRRKMTVPKLIMLGALPAFPHKSSQHGLLLRTGKLRSTHVQRQK